MKKLLFAILMVALVVTCSGVSMAFAKEAEEITAVEPTMSDKTINIETEGNLLWVSEYSYQTDASFNAVPNTFAGYTLQLAGKTFDLSSIANWQPINNFHGTMSGNEDGSTVISGLNVTSQAADSEDYIGAGLCGNIAYSGGKPYFNYITIKNANVVALGAYAGAFVGSGYTAEFNYCKVVDSKIQGEQYIGGIVGSTYGSIKNCSVSGTEDNHTVVLIQTGSLEIFSENHDNAGGIIGIMGEGGGVIDNCTVIYTDVSASRQVGGIAGNIQYGNTVTNCTVSYCNISSTSVGSALTERFSPALGGIVGEARGNTTSTMTVTDNTVDNTVLTKRSTSLLHQYVGWIIGVVLPNNSSLTLSGNTFPEGTWNERGN